MLFLADSGKRLMLDCGNYTPFVVRDEMNIDITTQEIDGLYVSHLHDDHAAGIGIFALYNYFLNIKVKDGKRIKLYIHHSLLDKLWASIKEGLDTVQGENVTIDTFFEVHSIMDDGEFVWEEYNFELIQTLHVMANRKIMNSFGLMVFKDQDNKTFITTDTQFTYPCPLQTFYSQAKRIFHDGEVGWKTGVHPNIEDMNTFMPEDVKKITRIYHYNDLPEKHDELGYAGFIEKFDIFDLSDPEVV